MPEDTFSMLSSEIDRILSTIPEAVRSRLASPVAAERLHAELFLSTSKSCQGLAELLKRSRLIAEPAPMRVFVHGATLFDPESIAVWLVKRGTVVGPRMAVSDLDNFSRTASFAAREVIVLDGISVEETYPLTSGVHIQPLATLQPTQFRDQFSASTSWQPHRDRAALVRSFDHPVILRAPDESSPTSVPEIVEHELLGDVARLITLLGKPAPARVAQWWEHDSAIPCRAETTAAAVTMGFESSFHPVRLDGAAVELVRQWIPLVQQCPPRLLHIMRVVLDRLSTAKRRSTRVDRAIDLGVAAEALFLRTPGEDQSELAFRLATRAAWLIGGSKAERVEIFDSFRALYDARSKAVHTGAVPDKVKGRDVGEVLEGGCRLLERAALATLQEPQRELVHIHL